MIPGMNVLGAAFGLIGQQTMLWRRATGRTQNALGQWVTAYAAPEPLRGSFQPVDKAKYTELGLDMAKKYWTFYVSAGVEGINRGESPDQLVFNGRLFTVEDETDWLEIDGWRGVLCVEVGVFDE